MGLLKLLKEWLEPDLDKMAERERAKGYLVLICRKEPETRQKEIDE
jgi:hypothetical protein